MAVVVVRLLGQRRARLGLVGEGASAGGRDAQLDAAEARLEARGILANGAFTDDGRALRADVELNTDRQMRPAIDALGDEFDELVGIIEPWSDAVREAGGYIKSAISLTGTRD